MRYMVMEIGSNLKLTVLVIGVSDVDGLSIALGNAKKPLLNQDDRILWLEAIGTTDFLNSRESLLQYAEDRAKQLNEWSAT